MFYFYYLDISLGSSYELITQLLIAKHRNYINQETFNNLEMKIEEFQRMTISFQNGLASLFSTFYVLFSFL